MDKAISVRTITPGTDRDRAPGGLGHVDSGRYSVAKNRIRDAWDGDREYYTALLDPFATLFCELAHTDSRALRSRLWLQQPSQSSAVSRPASRNCWMASRRGISRPCR